MLYPRQSYGTLIVNEKAEESHTMCQGDHTGRNSHLLPVVTILEQLSSPWTECACWGILPEI